MGSLSPEDTLEPIAVVGYSLKFPQDAVNPESFWKMLTEGRSALSEIPKDRFNLDAFYHPDASRQDTLPVRGGHFLKEDISRFDAPFFSITPAEAASMDPQQRMLLETAYRALENAGIPIEEVSGSQTGVYIGSFTDDYKVMSMKDTGLKSRYMSIGTSASILANRLNWFYDFNGPSVQVDTACSSGLTALHFAVQGLRARESSMALVGGSNLMIGPDTPTILARLNFLSHDSKCFSFDHRANGYSRGEGLGVLVLKRLSDAIMDNDTIRVVIRNTGINQDGRTPGITQPSGKSQQALIRQTYINAGLDLATTGYFEAHGTGTAIGDPIEASAIGAVFSSHRSSEDPLYVGAVKSNIGHLEGASGIAGFIKAIQALEYGVIPPNVNFERVNPKIDTIALKIKFPLENTPWPSTGLRRASVNSFGFGGSNAHAVIDDAYNYLKQRNMAGNHCTAPLPPSSYPGPDSEDLSHTLSLNHKLMNSQSTIKPRLLILSSVDEAGVTRIAKSYTEWWSRQRLENDYMFLDNLAYTLSSRRSNLPWKSYMVVSAPAEIKTLETMISKPAKSTSDGRLGFVFTGQGAQWFAMGRELISSYTLIRDSLRRADAFLKTLGCEWSLLEELQMDKETSRINYPAYSQPLCTALQVAIVDLLASFGVHPQVVLGHSSGELASAYCAGAITQESAWKLAYYRGALAAELAESRTKCGAMLSVGLSVLDSQALIDRATSTFDYADISIGCINSPINVSVTGDEAQIDVLKRILDDEHIFNRKLQVNVAYHSSHMNAISERYCALIQGLEFGPVDSEIPRPVMVSSVTGKVISSIQLCEPEYWVRNMVSAVDFLGAVSTACVQPAKARQKLGARREASLAVTNLLELGPHSALQGPIRDILKALGKSNITYNSVLVRNRPATESLLEAVGRLHCMGYKADLGKANDLRCSNSSDRPVVLTDLPEYPFNHSQSYWQESRLSSNYRFRKQARNDFLGTPVADWNPADARWRNIISVTESPWIEDHRINGTYLYPAAGMLAMALEGSRQLADPDKKISCFRVKDAVFHKALPISLNAEGTDTMFSLRASQNAWSEFRLSVVDNDTWHENCHGFVKVEYEEDRLTEDGSAHCQALFQQGFEACNNQKESKDLYDSMRNMGFDYGKTFQALQNLSMGDQSGTSASLSLGQCEARGRSTQPPVVHPAVLDALFQLALADLCLCGQKKIPTLAPTRLQSMWISCKGLGEVTNGSVDTFARSEFLASHVTESTVVAANSDGSPCIFVDKLETTAVTAQQDAESPDNTVVRRLCFSMEARPDVTVSNLQKIAAYCEAAGLGASSQTDYCQEMTFVLYCFLKNTLEIIANKPLPTLPPHLDKFVAWMEVYLKKCEMCDIPWSSPEWKSLSLDKENFEAACRRVERATSEGKLFVEVGRNLLPILYDDYDPLDLFFKTDLAHNYYEGHFGDKSSFSALANYVDALAHKNPAMNILEIGSGTGAATKLMLETLKLGDTHRYAQYDYTDISAGFFENARAKFVHYVDRMRFKILDIEKDPQKQGFEVCTYDMVVACSVLHATSDLKVTMSNARKLLKPGGTLILIEIVRPEILRAGFAFGLLSGWWNSIDGRTMGPCVSADAWNNILIETGFTGNELVFNDDQDERCHEISTIISTAGPETSLTSIQTPNTIIIAAEGSVLQHSIAKQICTQLESQGKQEPKILSPTEVASQGLLSGLFCISLLELEGNFLSEIDDINFAVLKRIIERSVALLYVTAGGGSPQKSVPEHDMVVGLARVLCNENANIKFTSLALSLSDFDPTAERYVEHIVNVFNDMMKQDMPGCESNYVERDDVLYITRATEDKNLNEHVSHSIKPQVRSLQEFGKGPALSMKVESLGLLDSITFIEDELFIAPLGDHEIEVDVKVAGVNFKDLLTALGRVASYLMGFECAGIVSRVGSQVIDHRVGDRVFAVSYSGTFKNYTRCREDWALPIPEDITYAEAASMVATGATAYYALHRSANLRRGETILIHGGAGGTGQAAIQIAQLYGAEVFTTVGAEDKKELLVKEYGIPEDHIFHSRDLSFAHGVKRMTGGRGVDVVLNAMSGEGLVASWECIAPFGRFVEISIKDIMSRNHLPMFPFSRNASFIALNMAVIATEAPHLMGQILKDVVGLMQNRQLKPAQPLQVYGVGQIEEAFRYMQSGNNVGKIVIEMRPDDKVPTVLTNRPSYGFDPNATYLIAGGLGGLGRSVTRWFANRGAKYLALLSRSGPRGQAALDLVDEIIAMGVKVETPVCDITNCQELSTVLSSLSSSMPPIKGCIQASMVLRDSLFENMTHEDFLASVKPKVQGSWNLHSCLPKGMDFFIMFASMSGVIGFPGQANYASGNIYQDALARFRNANDEKGVALDLGPMKGEGFLAEAGNEKVAQQVKSFGQALEISVEELHGLLDHYCNPALGLLGPAHSQCVLSINSPAAIRATGFDEPQWLHNSRFRYLYQMSSSATKTITVAASSVDFQTAFHTTSSMDEISSVIAQELVKKLARSVSIPESDIDTNKPIHIYGVDSLVAVELRTWFNREVGADVAIFEIMGSGNSLMAVSQLVAEKSKYRQAGGVK